MECAIERKEGHNNNILLNSDNKLEMFILRFFINRQCCIHAAINRCIGKVCACYKHDTAMCMEGTQWGEQNRKETAKRQSKWPKETGRHSVTKMARDKRSMYTCVWPALCTFVFWSVVKRLQGNRSTWVVFLCRQQKKTRNADEKERAKKNQHFFFIPANKR